MKPILPAVDKGISMYPFKIKTRIALGFKNQGVVGQPDTG